MLLMIERPRYGHPVTATARAARVLRSAIGIVDSVLSWPFRVHENRRLVDQLAAMSDHDLKDIGLTRQDLRDSTAFPPARDPGRLFASRAAGRRHAR